MAMLTNLFGLRSAPVLPPPPEPIRQPSPGALHETAGFQVVPDSIEELAAVSETADCQVVPDRPQLSPHAPILPEQRFIQELSRLQEFIRGNSHSMAGRIEEMERDLKACMAEHVIHIREAADRAAQSGFWAILSKIGAALSSALAILTGASLIATGGGVVVGGMMIAAGVISLVNFVMVETHSWDWLSKKMVHDNETLQKQVAAMLPAIIGVTAGVLGVFGAVGAVGQANQAVLVFQTTVSLFQGMTHIGDGIAKGRLLNCQADLGMIEASTSVVRHFYEATNRSLGSVQQELQTHYTSFKRIINNLIQSAQASLRPLSG